MFLRTSASAIAFLILAIPARGDLNLYVSNYDGTTLANPRVTQFNASTGVSGGNLILGGHLTLPDGLAAGPNGNLFVSDFFSGTVQQYNPVTGAFISTFVSAGSGGLGVPQEITFGPNGNLFVANNLGNILQYSGSTGAFLGVFASGIGLPEDLTFGPNGNLFVSDAYLSGVKEFNGITGAFIGNFVQPGTLSGASGITFGPNGNLYAISPFSNSVYQFNGTTGTLVNQFIQPNSGGLFVPYDLAFGPGGNLYISSQNPNQSQTNPSGAILQYNGQTGQFIDQFVSFDSGLMGTPHPGLLFADFAAVPEPSTATIAVLGAIGLVLVFRPKPSSAAGSTSDPAGSNAITRPQNSRPRPSMY